MLRGIAGLREHEGSDLGVSAWRPVEFPELDLFAAVTEEHRWLGEEQAAQASPALLGSAGAYYTLSLGPRLAEELYCFEGFSHVLNYGLDRVRFPSPMAGGRVRMRARLSRVEELERAAQITITQTFQCEGGPAPVCVAQLLVRLAL